MATKDALHRLVDELPDDEDYLELVTKAVTSLRPDPVMKAFLEAPLDDEPITPEEREAALEARAAVARGEVVSHEEVGRRLALW